MLEKLAFEKHVGKEENSGTVTSIFLPFPSVFLKVSETSTLSVILTQSSVNPQDLNSKSFCSLLKIHKDIIKVDNLYKEKMVFNDNGKHWCALNHMISNLHRCRKIENAGHPAFLLFSFSHVVFIGILFQGLSEP